MSEICIIALSYLVVVAIIVIAMLYLERHW